MRPRLLRLLSWLLAVEPVDVDAVEAHADRVALELGELTDSRDVAAVDEWGHLC